MSTPNALPLASHPFKPEPMVYLSDALAAIAAASAVSAPCIQFMSSDELKPRTPAEKKAYLEGVDDGKMYAVRDGLASASAAPQPPSAAERNFCERCGKRLFDGHIHTCTPPSAAITPEFAKAKAKAKPMARAGGTAMQPLTDDDIQQIMKMLERHQTFNYEPDCPVAAMHRKLKTMLDYNITKAAP
jgi:hypothetical protein